MNKRHSIPKQRDDRLKPRVVGAGLVALDVIVNLSTEDEPQYFAGGTCANVLTILSYLGWDARPISRLKNNVSADWLINDLGQWEVDTSLISRTDDGSTPIIIQNIREVADGSRTHSFSIRCPCCGAYLPGYKSILGSDAEGIGNNLGHHQVFFFDRVSRGTLNLAKSSAARGALIVFEPSGIGEARLFREAWSIAHVVKYSHDRLRDIADLDLHTVRNDLLLEIETLGASGLRYRSRLANARTHGWKTLEVIPTTVLKDAAGAGDWCTAGVIHKLARGGLNGFRKINKDRLSHALRFGQAVASWNCAFESARGGMYRVSKPQFQRQIRRLLDGKTIRLQADNLDSVPEDLRKLCPTCESAEFNGHKKTGTRA